MHGLGAYSLGAYSLINTETAAEWHHVMFCALA